jgi:co-chaperonin GroES (HSP10)
MMTDQVTNGSGAAKEGYAGWRGDKGPNPANTSGFRATGHRVLLLCDVIEKKTESGILLPEKAVDAEKNKSTWATVIEIGPDAWSDKVADFCKVGDRVLVGLYTGVFRDGPKDGKPYRFVNDLDIISPEV